MRPLKTTLERNNPCNSCAHTASQSLAAWLSLICPDLDLHDLPSFARQKEKNFNPFSNISLKIKLKNNTTLHVDSASLSLTPSSPFSSSLTSSISLALNDLKRSENSIRELTHYHQHLTTPQTVTNQPTDVHACVASFCDLFKISYQDIPLSTLLTYSVTHECLLVILVAFCREKQIDYSQGWLPVLLNLCYLIPCPLLFVDLAYLFFHRFLTLACPHLWNPTTLAPSCCEPQKTLSMLFHQLLQFHFPSVSFYFDKLYHTTLWNLHWFDSLATNHFESPQSWIRVWYSLFFLSFFRLLPHQKFSNNPDHSIAWTKRISCPSGIYSEWMLFLLSLVNIFFVLPEHRGKSTCDLVERLHQYLCGCLCNENTLFWDDLISLYPTQPNTRYFLQPSMDQCKNCFSMKTPPHPNLHPPVWPYYIHSMINLASKTPMYWLSRLSGHLNELNQRGCFSSATGLYEYSTKCCLPVFANELEFIHQTKCFSHSSPDSSTPFHNDLSNYNQDTLQSFTFCPTMSHEYTNVHQDSEPLQKSCAEQHVENLPHTTANSLPSSPSCCVSSSSQLCLSPRTTSYTNSNNITFPHFWSHCFHPAALNAQIHIPYRPIVLLIPFNQKFLSLAYDHEGFVDPLDVIHCTLSAMFVFILTPCYPDHNNIQGIRRITPASSTQTTRHNPHLSFWLSSSLDTTINLLQLWVKRCREQPQTFTVIQLDHLYPIPLRHRPEEVRDGVIQATATNVSNPSSLQWLSYKCEPYLCDISFILRAVERGIPYVTVCPDFCSSSSPFILSVRNTLRHLIAQHLIILSPLFSKQRIVQTFNVSKTFFSFFQSATPPTPATGLSHLNHSWIHERANNASKYVKNYMSSLPSKATPKNARSPSSPIAVLRRIPHPKKNPSVALNLGNSNHALEKTNSTTWNWFQFFPQSKNHLNTPPNPPQSKKPTISSSLVSRKSRTETTPTHDHTTDVLVNPVLTSFNQKMDQSHEKNNSCTSQKMSLSPFPASLPPRRYRTMFWHRRKKSHTLTKRFREQIDLPAACIQHTPADIPANETTAFVEWSSKETKLLNSQRTLHVFAKTRKKTAWTQQKHVYTTHKTGWTPTGNKSSDTASPFTRQSTLTLSTFLLDQFWKASQTADAVWGKSSSGTTTGVKVLQHNTSKLTNTENQIKGCITPSRSMWTTSQEKDTRQRSCFHQIFFTSFMSRYVFFEADIFLEARLTHKVTRNAFHHILTLMIQKKEMLEAYQTPPLLLTLLQRHFFRLLTLPFQNTPVSFSVQTLSDFYFPI